MNFKRSSILLIAGLLATLVFSQVLTAQVLRKSGFLLNNPDASEFIGGNSVNDIAVSADTVILSTGNGVSISVDNGVSWTNYDEDNTPWRGSPTALRFEKGRIWIATLFDSSFSIEPTYGPGGGVSYSDDLGETWVLLGQPQDVRGIDTVVRANGDTIALTAINTPVDNVTFDMAINDTSIWITSFAAGTWLADISPERQVSEFHRAILPPDNIDTLKADVFYDFLLDPVPHLNYRSFATIWGSSEIWVGTANGINKSDDGGLSWVKYTAQNSGISGNFVVALGKQNYLGNEVIWASTRIAEQEGEFNALSFTDNGGDTWQTVLDNVRGFNFGFNDETVYVASDRGLYRSADGGQHWENITRIVELETTDQIISNDHFAVGVTDNRLWVGTRGGLGSASPNANNWEIDRASVTTSESDEIKGYPNPFAPLQESNAEGFRIEYNAPEDVYVTLEFYNYAIELVRIVVQDLFRPGGNIYAEVWDGKNDNGDIVANGVYFYRFKLNKKVRWGKVIILN